MHFENKQQKYWITV